MLAGVPPPDDIARVKLNAARRMAELRTAAGLTQTEVEKLRWELTDILEPEDDVLFIPICTDCVRGVRDHTSGKEPIPWPAAPPKFYIV